MRRVYLDNNATTPMDERVLEAMTPFFLKDFGNAASIHGDGQKARAAVESARREAARLLGVDPRDLVFTSGGTEADNLAVRGLASFHAQQGRHIIASAIEHPAVLRSCERLEEEGFEATYLEVDEQGLIRLDELEEEIRDDTILISVMHANNEVGAIQPVEAVSELARKHAVPFHTDAVQTVGKIPLDATELGVDLLSLSSHKFHGPKGVGALWVRKEIGLKPLSLGGSHERGRRAGTENVPGIVGLGEACRLASLELEDFGERVGKLRDRLEEGIVDNVPDAVVNGTVASRMPHVTNISFLGLEGEALLIALDFQGIAVSTGAACASGSLEPSHVLRAMRLDKERIQGAIRFSLSRMTTDEDVDYVLETLPPMVRRMREMSSQAK